MDSPDQAERSHAHGLQVGVSGGDFEGGAEDLCSYELRHLVVGKRGQGPLVGRGGRSGRASEDAGGGDGWRWREVRRRDGMGGDGGGGGGGGEAQRGCDGRGAVSTPSAANLVWPEPKPKRR